MTVAVCFSFEKYQVFGRYLSMLPFDFNDKRHVGNYKPALLFFINVGIRTGLCVSRLIPQVLKLTII